MRKMTSFTKERMITEIKKIKELTAKNPISSSYFQENYKTLCSYGVISELCKENFIKKQKLQGHFRKS